MTYYNRETIERLYENYLNNFEGSIPMSFEEFADQYMDINREDEFKNE